MTEHVIVHQILCLSVIDNTVHVWAETPFPYLAYVSWTPVHSADVLCVANQKHRLVLGLVHLPNIVCDVSISQGKCTHTEEKIHNSHIHIHTRVPIQNTQAFNSPNHKLQFLHPWYPTAGDNAGADDTEKKRKLRSSLEELLIDYAQDLILRSSFIKVSK